MLKINFKTPKQDSNQSKVKKETESTFWKKFAFSKLHFAYFALAYVVYFVLTILISISFTSGLATSVNQFTVGQIWTINQSQVVQNFFTVDYTNYQLVLFVAITLVVTFLIFAFVYFLIDLKRNGQKMVFRNINWKLIYFIFILLVLVIWMIFVLVELTSVAKSYQSITAEPIKLGGLWILNSEHNQVSRTGLNSAIIALCWVWLVLFTASFFALAYTGREQRQK